MEQSDEVPTVHHKPIEKMSKELFNEKMAEIRQIWTDNFTEEMGAYFCIIGLRPFGSEEEPGVEPNVVLNPTFTKTCTEITQAFVYSAIEDLFKGLKERAISGVPTSGTIQ